jgi:hypothetical protein
MVDAAVPSRFVKFLRSIMPRKDVAELYNAIGFNKHGKTEFYRDVIQHMKNSDDRFVIAPGIKGMVMSVFTLPSYDVVFKIIKDRFDPPKKVTEASPRMQRFFGEDSAARIAPDLVERLLRHPYELHVRELERLLSLAATTSMGEYLALTPDLTAELDGIVGTTPSDEREDERGRVQRAVSDSGGRLGLAAEKLGVSRHALYRLLKKHDIENP